MVDYINEVFPFSYHLLAHKLYTAEGDGIALYIETYFSYFEIEINKIQVFI